MVLQVRDSPEDSSPPVIVVTSQALSSSQVVGHILLLLLSQAAVLRTNSWLYHHYTVQSRLQYGLAYGTSPPAALSPLYYPHTQYCDPLHSAYLQAAHHLPYSPYTYGPPVSYYPGPPDPPPSLPDTRQSPGPLDFSKGHAWDHWDYPRPQDLSAKSPGWRSEDSGSPQENPGAFLGERGGYYSGWGSEARGVKREREGGDTINPHCV